MGIQENIIAQDILARFGQSRCNKRSNNPIQVTQGLIGIVIKGQTEMSAISVFHVKKRDVPLKPAPPEAVMSLHQGPSITPAV